MKAGTKRTAPKPKDVRAPSFTPAREPPKDSVPLSEQRLAKLADELYTARETRYALDKEVKKLKDRETLIRKRLIENLPRLRATGIAGKVARAQIEDKRICKVVDWDQFYRFVAKDNWDCLQRRVNDKAIGDRWDDKKSVPGVSPDNVKVISLTKV